MNAHKRGWCLLRIVKVENSKKPHGVEIRALMGVPEFEQLHGSLHDLCVFATKTLGERATAVKTGARHSWIKYLLLPVRLRRQFKTDEFDFENIECGVARYRDTLYVIYGVKRNVPADSPAEGSD